MKTGLFSGWKARFYAVCMLMLVSAMAVGVPATAFAKAEVTPVQSADVVTEQLTPPAPPAAAAPAVAAPVVDKGDVAWMLTSTLLVLLMVVPGLALFYGGMVRSKNVLSVLIQVGVVFSLIAILWVLYGYSLAFADGGLFVGTLNKALLHGVDTTTLADTFSKGFKLPEYVFVAFQLTFAGITGALIVGAFAERVKFAAVLLFIVIWFTFGYLPLAHMVWAAPGFLFTKGALDFAGGTVVHINAGVAGLVGSYFVGKRLGFGQTALKPHNVTLTFVGASLLWVGWFGFNAGSALEANATAALAFLNTLLATAAAVLAWSLVEKLVKGKSSALGVASGMVAGLVGITPAAGTVGPFGAIAIGVAAGAICVWGVTGLKKLLNADDTLDVFGVHGVGGIVGAILTGVFTDKALGGAGYAEGVSMGHQVLVQATGVGVTVVWIGVVSVVGFLVAKLVFGLRVSEEAEREGLDITSHGEAAYES
ncbi:ammonium transporter [Xanthomonas graminis]|jgi:Amt family ammonium transporter|uniref:Ammonium transporter n=1 Tax=Xanthomonas graminis pv. graminis TaxID=134874 RepID=A0A1M4ISJ6_9XANT|nr:ammonium transporter [Xanthomonas translucens]EKU23601.1 ammonium transporter [Xanthomonas translucens pv. graminis ART-Xtg29]OAX61056.1 ammonia channel protein [Xanthomonas translucens pv. graminis]UKE54361.1 ammonium transporter [Xanthomonas translucens pv. graminis]WIH08954.1 ammonium transporter [Xanthomonas translucens pv. graminis]WIH12268.1 ammonium transporter [Xanthomonas translucens pv. graminis]